MSNIFGMRGLIDFSIQSIVTTYAFFLPLNPPDDSAISYNVQHIPEVRWVGTSLRPKPLTWWGKDLDGAGANASCAVGNMLVMRGR